MKAAYRSIERVQRRMKHRIVFITLLLLLALPVLAQEPVTRISTPPDASTVQFESVVDGLRRPLFLTHAGDGSGRLFIMEQGGIIYVTDNTGENQSIFLDLTSLVSPSANRNSYSEQGLLGLAFRPDYASSGIFFVNYTDRQGNTVVARYHVSPDDANTADPNSAEIIFTQEQPYENHNGGHMAFGPDGYLYISLGDGGGAGDPTESALELDSLLGKILRVDVNDDTGGYRIPEGNPFSGSGLPEIWSYGLRNVWRFSFDRATGDLYLGDVGQNAWEEINFQPVESTGGENYGWDGYEGTHVYEEESVTENVVMPIAEYEHGSTGGCSVTGGYVYRGEQLPQLQGVYFYSDYCSGRVWIAYRDESGAWQSGEFMETRMQVSSFGEDEAGELYIIDYNGEVHRLVAS
jgi:glucose/arabinose dehydrogenase